MAAGASTGNLRDYYGRCRLDRTCQCCFFLGERSNSVQMACPTGCIREANLMEVEGQKPKVSVCVVTYNHENCLRQCLQSLVEQQTDFDFEVIVADDCSTDGTPAVVEEFAQRYPAVVKPVFHQKNLGPFANYLFVHGQATGKYVAHMDGDDYALPGKLKVQADFLDEHPNCNIVWHLVDLLEPDGRVRKSRQAANKAPELWFRKADQINYILIGAHSSKMYRAGLEKVKVPEAGFLDFFIDATQLRNGAGVLLCGRSYGVYRMGVGISSSGSTKPILLGNLEWFLVNEPQYRNEVNAAALHLLLYDIKSFSPGCLGTGRLFLRSFSVGGVFLYVRTFARRRMLAF